MPFIDPTEAGTSFRWIIVIGCDLRPFHSGGKMKKTSRFRVIGIALSLLAVVVIGWRLMPETSAQKGTDMNRKADAASQVEAAPPDNDALILLNARQIDVKSPDVQAERNDVGNFSGKRMHIVRFRGPIQNAWYLSLTDAGLEVVTYIPHYAYLVYGDAKSIQRIQARSKMLNSPIEWDGEYKDEYRINPGVYFSAKLDGGREGLRSDEFEIQLYKDDEVNAETFRLIDKLQTRTIKGRQEVLHYINFVTGLSEEGMLELAKRPDVVSIFPYIEPQKYDERQDWVLVGNLSGNVPATGDYLAYLASKGFTQAQFTASNFTVDVSDSGVDTATPASPNQWLLRTGGDPAGASRYTYSRLVGTPNGGSTLQGCDGHGNINATIIAGYVPTGGIFAAAPHADASGYRYGLGIAPFVKVGSSVIFDPGSFTNPNLPNLQSMAYQDGARISSNSWGAGVGGAYSTSSQTFDALVRDAQPTGSTNATAGNQEMVVVFAAGNDGPGTNTTGAPGTAKNVITVGASENVHPFGGADGCGTTDAEANSALDIVGFSSRGPLDDGRVKPDIMLPGTHVTGGVAQNVLANPVAGNGTMLTCFTANGVCAGPPPSNFFPLGQQWYTASSGTSHSTPAISGYAALIRQHFINENFISSTAGGGVPPSPAMTKALMMNSTEYMTGVGANDNLPSNSQGMGLADMNRYFDIFAQSRILRDQVAADVFTDTDTARAFTGNIVDNTKPFRVTLAWSDAPGATSGNAFVNNLDLEVTVGGVSYKGNVFTGANSSAGGTADTRNNVESVFVPAGVTGPFAVIVRATNIAGNGLPDNADATDQDFALIVSNALQGNSAVLGAPTPVVTTGNNLIEPSEANVLNIPLSNFGNLSATAVSAVLSTTTPGVTVTQSNSAYADIAAGGSQPNISGYGVSTDASVANLATIGLTLTVTYTGGTSPAIFNFTLPVARPSLNRGTTVVTTGNGFIEPSECNLLNIPINNTGDASATAVSAVLSTTTPGVTITAPNSAYPNIGPGSSQTNTSSYQVSTDNTVACATNINFTLTVTNTGGPSPVQFNFALPVGLPPVGNYTFTSATGSVGSGGTLVPGSADDDVAVSVPLPSGFNFTVYGTAVTSLSASTNGALKVNNAAATTFSNTALPATGFATGPNLLPYWDDLDARPITTTNGGIFTETTGSAPNRIFKVEWRTRHFVSPQPVGPVDTNFAVIFHENSDAFEFVYPAAGVGAFAGGVQATVGVQSTNTGTDFTQFSFNTASLTNGQQLNAAHAPGVCNPGAGPCAGPVLFATVGGRVTATGGRGIKGARLIMTDSGVFARGSTTNSFGFYNFFNVPTGVQYTVTPSAKRFTFTPQNVTPSGDVSNLNFTGTAVP